MATTPRDNRAARLCDTDLAPFEFVGAAGRDRAFSIQCYLSLTMRRPTRRNFSRVYRFRRRAGRIVLMSALGGVLAACSEPSHPQPNVLLYVVDTLRADALESYRANGEAGALTPHFDALAREGVVFEKAYASSSWTRASMAAILTGLHPWRHSVEGRMDRLSREATTLPELFASEGYTTALITANPNVSRVFGFDEPFGELRELFDRSAPGVVTGRQLITPSDVVTQELSDWLGDNSEPFFLVALPIDPHRPYKPPARHDPALHKTGEDVSAKRVPKTRSRMRELYHGEVSFNDESFGALVEAMKKRGVWDDTIVIVTSDHGEEFWEYGGAGHGKNLLEEVLRVPLIIRNPGDGRLHAGMRVQRPISHVDLAPTLLDLLGKPIPEAMDGHAFFAASTSDPSPVYAGLELDGLSLRAAIGRRYKLLWDREGGDQLLYDLDRPRPESEPLPASIEPAAALAKRELRAGLEASSKLREGALERESAGSLPPNHRDALRALGYIE